MNNNVGTLARRQHKGLIVLGGLLLALVAGCGSKSGTTTTSTVPNSFINASMVIGHNAYNLYKPNQAKSGDTVAPTASTLSNTTGSIATNGTLFYVADTNNHRILGWNEVPSTPGQAADFVIGQANLTSNDAGIGADGLAYPTKVSISDDGQYLVVADTGNNRVLIWNGLPTQNQPANVVIGQVDFNGDQPNQGLTAPTAATLDNPTAAMIANGKLFVVDNNNNRLLIWNTVPVANDTNADVVWGQPQFSTNVANCGQAQPQNDMNCTLFGNGNYPISAYSLNQPHDLWTDGRKMFVADSSNNRVLFWSQIPVANTTAATYVMGQGSFASGAGVGGTSQNTMSGPYSVASDGSRVFVADTNNNRVLVFNTFPTASAPNADTVLGQHFWTRKTANDDDQNGIQDAAPTARTLDLPTGVFVESAGGDVYVTDSANNRVLAFNPQ